MEYTQDHDAVVSMQNHQTAGWSEMSTTPPVRPAVSANVCGAIGCHQEENLKIVRPGDGYQRVLCRRHATQLLSAGVQR